MVYRIPPAVALMMSALKPRLNIPNTRHAKNQNKTTKKHFENGYKLVS